MRRRGRGRLTTFDHTNEPWWYAVRPLCVDLGQLEERKGGNEGEFISRNLSGRFFLFSFSTTGPVPSKSHILVSPF